MDPESDFQKKMVEYLESVHMGEFITGSLEDVKKNVDIAELDDEYKIQLRHFQCHLHPSVTKMNVGNENTVKQLVCGKLNLILS